MVITMKVVLQRVKNACVTVDGATVGSCGRGLLLLLGVAQGDNESDADALAHKIVNLRVFTDDNDKMNLSVKDIGGDTLIVSNFTLLADYRRGNRPDYMLSARPDEAKRLYLYFTEIVARELSRERVSNGRFGEHMEVMMTGDGPVTLTLDSAVLLKKPNAGN